MGQLPEPFGGRSMGPKHSGEIDDLSTGLPWIARPWASRAWPSHTPASAGVAMSKRPKAVIASIRIMVEDSLSSELGARASKPRHSVRTPSLRNLSAGRLTGHRVISLVHLKRAACAHKQMRCQGQKNTRHHMLLSHPWSYQAGAAAWDSATSPDEARWSTLCSLTKSLRKSEVEMMPTSSRPSVTKTRCR